MESTRQCASMRHVQEVEVPPSEKIPTPRRIIKKINLDLNKLKGTGLDRKLAEALRRQNSAPGLALSCSPAAKPENLEKSPIPGNSPSTSTAVQQQLRQPATQPIKKRSAVSDYIEKIVPHKTEAERSLHVKTLLKNRILNKNLGSSPVKQPVPRTPPSAAQGSPGPEITVTPPIFSVPFAKPEVAVRPKQPPLLLNLVNQLPKHRAMCTSGIVRHPVSRNSEQLPPGQPVRQYPMQPLQYPPQHSLQLPIQHLQQHPFPHPPAPYSSELSLQHPLPVTQTAPPIPSTSRGFKSTSPPLIVLENKVLAPNEKIDLSGLTLPQGIPLEKPATVETPATLIPPKVSPPKGKYILSTQKLTVSPEKLAEVAKEIRHKVQQMELRSPYAPSASVNVNECLVKPLSVPAERIIIEQPTTPIIQSDTQDVITLETPSVSKTQELPVSEVKSLQPEELAGENCQQKSPASKVLSAVDFIAQLTAEQSLDDSSFMELSPEEQRLNALFGGSSFALKEPTEIVKEAELPKEPVVVVQPPKEPIQEIPPQPEEELAIGKIVQMDDMNILHATLDVNSDSTNVLRISPNALKLEMSVVNFEDKSLPIQNEKPLPNILAEQPTNANEVEMPLEKDIKEPEKESKPPAKRLPIRSKKAKINLVQRSKRPGLLKAVEAKKTKLELEENDEPAEDADAPQNRVEEMEVIVNVDDNLRSVIASPNVSSVENNPKVSADGRQSEEEVEENSEPERSAIGEANPEAREEESEAKRDLSQLYHPPKMPKNKANKNIPSRETVEDPTECSVSLIDILSQEPPLPQGEPQVPFRKETFDTGSIVTSTPDGTGIQNLIGHLTAEKVTPQIKKHSPTSENTPKAIPRKKLVKTRPVLSKRSVKATPSGVAEKQTSPEELPNGGGRVPTSSTSDDDGSIFHGFEEKRSRTPIRSKRVRQMRINETDISDDATPDHDETEEEQLPLPKKLPAELKKEVECDSGSSSPRDFGWDAPIDSPQNAEVEATKGENLPEDTVNDSQSNAISDNSNKNTEKNNADVEDQAVNKEFQSEQQDKSRSVQRETKTIECDQNVSKSEKEQPKRQSRGSLKTKKQAKVTETAEENLKHLDSTSELVDISLSQEQIEEQPETLKKFIGKRQTRGNSKNKKSLNISEEPVEDSIKETEPPQEVEMSEEPSTSGKSLRKRHSRSRTPKLQPNVPPKEIEIQVATTNEADKSKITPKRRGRKPKAAAVSQPEEPLETREDKAAEEPKEVETPVYSGRLSRYRHLDKSQVKDEAEAAKDSIDTPKGRSCRSRKTKIESPRKTEIKAEPDETPTAEPKKDDKEPEMGNETQTTQNSASNEVPETNNTDLPQSDKPPENQTESEVPIKPKRPRGRPRKVVQPEPAETSIIEEKVADISDVNDANESSTSGYSRRKRKMRSITPIIDYKSDDEEEEAPRYIKKTKSQFIEDSVISEKADTTLVPQDEPVVPRKRGRKSNAERARLAELSNAAATLQKSEPAAVPAAVQSPQIKGRKRDAELDKPMPKVMKIDYNAVMDPNAVFNQRLLLIRKREQLETDEIVTDEGKGEGPLQCGLCLARSTQKNWANHLLEHYGVGWTIDETPEPLTRASVQTTMRLFHIANPDKAFACRMCGQRLGTFKGMFLHLECCGDKTRYECENCHRSYTKNSLTMHLRSCRPIIQEEVWKPSETEASEPVYSNCGREKRRSTIKAETKLKKIGKELSSPKSPEAGKDDFDTDSSDYEIAKDKESSEEYDSEGVDSNEDEPVTDDDVAHERPIRRDCNEKKKSQRTLGDSTAKPLFSRYVNPKSRMANKWKEFLETSYTTGVLYPQLRPSFSKVSPEEAIDLLPSKETKSMRYAYGEVKAESDWKQLQPLEGVTQKGEYFGYLGGAIKQLAWVPLPPNVETQYLLCSVRHKMKSYTKQCKYDSQDNALLMLLKCEVSAANRDNKSWPLKPKLHYGIRVPNGPVHSMAFIPSGGYDESANRLGLLAITNSCSDVHIYAVPLELTADEKNSDEDVVIQLKSLLTLRLDINSPVQDQCTKVCWSESAGHSFLVTGYGSGRVAFWDIGDTEGLNCFTQNSHTYFVPLNCLYVGERNIQCLDLHYDAKGPRWLAAGTFVRRFFVYDIANWSKPVPLMQNPISNLYLTSYCWSPICETMLLSSNDLFMKRLTRNVALNPSGINYDYRTLDSTVGAARGMHINIQENHLVLGTDIGDLAFVNVRDLNFGPSLNKVVGNSRAVTTCDWVNLSETAPDPKESITAESFLRDYGIKISPLAPVMTKDKNEYLNEKRMPANLEMLPFTRFNCVRCNWNATAHSWVAVGAEHGLLRILNFDRDNFF